MPDEPQYDYIDPDGVKRIVTVIPGTGSTGGPGQNFQVPVTDVVEVGSGRRFNGVPWATLKRRDSN